MRDVRPDKGECHKNHGGKDVKIVFDEYVSNETRRTYYVFNKKVDKDTAINIFAKDKKVAKRDVKVEYGYVKKDKLFFGYKTSNVIAVSRK